MTVVRVPLSAGEVRAISAGELGSLSLGKALDVIHAVHQSGDEAAIKTLYVDAGKVATSASGERLAQAGRHYWAHGEGAAKVGWGTPGDFDRCVRLVSKYMRNPKGYCAERHHDALGIWPATHAKLERGK